MSLLKSSLLNVQLESKFAMTIFDQVIMSQPVD